MSDPSDVAPATESMSFEEAMAELEGLIERIEQGTIGLEESLAARKRGDGLIRRCRSILDTAEQELEHMDAPVETQEP